jgi:hypothetical protein
MINFNVIKKKTEGDFKSPSVAKKDPRLWECYGLDKRWHYQYNTVGLSRYSEKVNIVLMSGI